MMYEMQFTNLNWTITSKLVARHRFKFRRFNIFIAFFASRILIAFGLSSSKEYYFCKPSKLKFTIKKLELINAFPIFKKSVWI